MNTVNYLLSFAGKPEEKSKKVQFKQEDYTNILSYFSSLLDLISKYNSIYQNNSREDDDQIIKQLNECRNKIPVIVVWGAQSSGKSSVLNKIFPELKLNLKSRQGLGTKCPVEIRAGPSYQRKIIIKNMITNTEDIMHTIDEAEKFIDEKFKSDITIDFKIKCEINHPMNICIVDLPGCVSKTDDLTKERYNKLRKEYLMKPETIILHVVNGTIDPDTDVSTPYLNNINNKIIKVLTNTDLWAIDISKSNSLYEYDNDPKKYTIAIVNNRENEIEIIDKLELNYLQKELIRGSVRLTEIISREHQQKVFDFMPEFLVCINKARDLIDTKLNLIGRQTPDMKSNAVEFRIFMTTKAKKEFDDGSELAIELNKIKDDIQMEKLQECISIIPKPQILAKELESGSRKQIEGSEGWNDLMQKYIVALVDKIKKETIIGHINKHCNILENYIRKTFRSEYKPCTISASKKIIIGVTQHFSLVRKNIISKITEMLDNIAIEPHNTDKQYIKQYQIDMHIEVVRKALMFINKQSDPLQSCKRFEQDPQKLLEFAMSDNLDDIYLSKAKQAHSQLINFWKSKCVYIYAAIVDILNNCERLFLEEIINQIQMINYDDLKEPDDINTQRTSLLDIYEISNKIVQIIKEYDN
jgi:predicted GTPase